MEMIIQILPDQYTIDDLNKTLDAVQNKEKKRAIVCKYEDAPPNKRIVYITKCVPGDVVLRERNGNDIYMQAKYIDNTPIPLFS